MRWTRHAITIALSAGTSAALAQDEAGFVLDDFDSTINDELGGPRTLSLDVLANPFSQLTRFEVVTDFGLDGASGALVFHAGIATEQTGTVTYDNNGAGLGLDLSGFNGLELDILQADQGFGMSVRAVDASGLVADWMGVVDATAVPSTRFIGFMGFDAPEGFDSSAVNSLELVFNTGESVVPSLDFVLGEVRTSVIPGPASVGLLGLGGLVALRRRR